MSYIPYIEATTSRLSKEAQKQIATAIAQLCTSKLKEDDIRAWRMVHGTIDQTEYDYLTKVTNPDTQEDYVYPAKLRWIPIQMKNINALLGMKSRREFRYMLRATDKRSLKEKEESYLKQIVSYYLAKIDEADKIMNYQFRQMEKQLQKLQGSYEQGQEQYAALKEQIAAGNEDIDPRMLQEIEVALEQIEAQLEMGQMQLELGQKAYENKKGLDEVAYNDIKTLLAKDEVDVYDRYVNILIQVYRNKLDAIRKSENMFVSITVTGKGFLYINIDESDRLEYKDVDATKVYYPYDESNYWSHRGRWQGLRERWSRSSFLDTYGKHLTAEDKKLYSAYHDDMNFAPTPYGGAIPSTGATLETDTVDLLRIWYKHLRKINKKDGAYIDGEVEGAEKALWIYERYYFVVADGVVIYTDIDKIQPRINDEMQDVILPIIGKTYSGINYNPYSPVKITRELAELYMVLHYQKELLIVASGVKGDIVDRSQLPDLMSDEEHRYHKKMGTLYIKTMNKDGRPVNSSFNQWKGYDDTLPESVMIIEKMCHQIDQQIGIMMGIPTPVLGQVQRQDQVGTFEMSNEQAMIVTETLFKECDEIETEAVSILANILGQYKNSEDEIAEIYQNNELLEYAKIPAYVLKDRRFSSYSYSNSREEKSIKEIKQLLLNQSTQGILPFETVLNIYDNYSLKELKTSVKYMMKQLELSHSKAQQQDHESKMQAQASAIKAAQEYEMMKKNIDVQVKKMQLELDNAIKQSRLKIEEDALRLREKEVAINAQLGIAKIETEREVEMAYLKDQSLHQKTALSLEALKLRLNAIINTFDIETKKGIESEKIATKTYGKEKIKD